MAVANTLAYYDIAIADEKNLIIVKAPLWPNTGSLPKKRVAESWVTLAPGTVYNSLFSS